MKTLGQKEAASPYSAHRSLRAINFYCNDARACSVQIAGDFNQWQPQPLERRLDGWWFVQIQLCHGHHHYRFLVDGKPRLDPAATGVARDDHGELVSVVAVS